MKGLFPQYDYSTPEDYADIWETALFIFDTNVLLNLYRYHKRTREELLGTLDKLIDRIWIPHHVALEFQRNRLTVIASQGRRFSEIRKVIEKVKQDLTNGINSLQLTKRHTLIDPEPLISGFEKLTNNFLSELEELQKIQQALNTPDPIKERIENIFNGKVGAAFTTQDEVDKKSKIAETRYKAKIPPGFKDADKDKDAPDEFYHQGIIYKRKYGDFFVWSQILDHAMNTPQRKIIFITDDAKEDWWKQIDLDGPKTLGPRSELVDEAINIGKLDSFLMYKPETFLKFANKFLATEISNETLKEVHEVSQINKLISLNNSFNTTTESLILETAVLEWVRTKHQNATLNNSYPDILATDDNGIIGYEIKVFKSFNARRLFEIIFRAAKSTGNHNLSYLNIVIIVNDYYALDIILRNLNSLKLPQASENLNIIFGEVTESPEGKLTFNPLHEIPYNEISM